jgi:Uma2 family endonuclease
MAQPQTRTGATVDDLYKVEGKAEIVGGEIVLMSPGGFGHGRVAGAIFRSLSVFEEATGLGYAIPDNVGFVVNLPNRRSFCPDAAFFIGESSGPKFLEGAPVFAAEVRSEEDYGPAAEKRLAAKRADYFAAGTRVVWDVDFLRDELVRSYSAERPEEPRVFRRGDAADGEPALPGWSMAVDALFKGNPRP